MCYGDALYDDLYENDTDVQICIEREDAERRTFQFFGPEKLETKVSYFLR